ncbi:LacI family DNA-binding transcriptional regulator [Paracoccus sp. MBLB3053]|uniref:LacI family DNA-binding transcriptional regulator n=1 Tax=Paracoccus aurantius TaxID=3073814 RepID=A0ABU2HW31_9RHOB|nr:LacI family DNA-binding transcriptional regulator [Paracoccus sp. MBLB3053]MDS9468720.1 LacI family DNA-binding transcriptional regulator [Paracoccus sp. MBLB3053]
MRRPTVHDVARTAKVSLATVDRVLNGREGVRPSTQTRVQAAIEALGFERDISAANLSKKRVYRFHFVLPDGPNSFMRNLDAEVRRHAAFALRDRTEISVTVVPPFDTRALATALNGIAGTEPDGVAVVASEASEVREAVAGLKARGIHVVTLVSDLPLSARSHFVGIDNVSAGRTAAALLGRFCRARPGKVVIVSGSMLVRDHVERRLGFEQVMASEFPELELLQPVEGRDQSELVEQKMRYVIQNYADITGVYNLGGGNHGLSRALEAIPAGTRPRVVAHELTTQSRLALQDGKFDAILHQDIEREVAAVTALLRAFCDGSEIAPGEGRVRIEIFMRDNLP